jgi:outer membrane protein insertion porin family
VKACFIKLVPVFAAIFLLTLSASGPLAAQEEGPYIADIIVEGGITLTVDTVSYYIGLMPGDPFIPEEISEGFHRLWESGLFEDIRVEVEPLESGDINLYIVVDERPFVSSVIFEGAKKLSASTLKDKLDEQGLEVPRNVPLRMAMLSRLETAIKEIYDTEGYRSARVDFNVEKVSKRERRVIFNIDEGAKIKIAEISFVGNESYSDRRLRMSLKKIKEKSFYRFMGSKLIFSEEAWEEDRENLRDFYKDRGHIDIKIGQPEMQLLAKKPNAPTLKKKKFRLHIEIPVEEGEPYTIGSIRVEGATVFDPKRLVTLFDVELGKTYRNKAIEAGLETVNNFYQNTGYVYSYVSPVMERREEGHVVDVVIDVFEGDQFHLGRLEFSGNTVTRDKVLRREFRLPEGSLMNMGMFRASVFKVNALGFWKLEEEPVEFDFDDENKRVNVVVKGNEVGRNDIQFGAGYSELDGFFGQLMFNTRNFLGRGDTLGISLQTGRRTDYYTLSFTEPYFMDRRIILGGSIFKTNLELDDFFRETTGATMTIGFGLGMYGSMSALLAYEDVYSKYAVARTGVPGFDDTDGHQRPWELPPIDPPDEEVNFEVFEGRTVSITPSYGRDSRDDPFDPNRGTRLLLRGRIAGGPLGGDYDYYRPEINYSQFMPLTKKTILAFNVEAGQFLTYDDSEIPVYERYRLGGDRSLRGIPYYSVLPRTEDGDFFYTPGGSQMGGDRYWLFNLEYQFRLGGPVKLVAFVDTGNTYHEDQGWDFSLFRKTTGLELRVFLPIFQAPIRFIYGYNIDPFPEEDSGDFQFSIGTTF